MYGLLTVLTYLFFFNESTIRVGALYTLYFNKIVHYW